MKMKAFLAVCTLFVTMALQASNINWAYLGTSLSSFGAPPEGSFGVGSTAVLILTASGTSYSTVFDTIQDGKFNTLNTISSSVLDAGAGNLLVGDAARADGLIVSTGVTSGTYDCFFAIFNTTTKPTEGDYFMMSDVIRNIATYEDGALQQPNANFMDMESSWTKIVPEPTVLALLALGVAGLALKRKVA